MVYGKSNSSKYAHTVRLNKEHARDKMEHSVSQSASIEFNRKPFYLENKKKE